MERHTLTELIKWHFDIGVDECMDDMPVDRTQVKPPKPVHAVATGQTVPKFVPPAASDNLGLPKSTMQGESPLGAAEAVAAAQTAAEKATNLQELAETIDKFEGCAVSRTASNMVFGSGDEKAKIMLIGHTAGEAEDRSGQIFVGMGGQLLTKMLKAIGLTRDDVYLSNFIYWRPPGNRSINDAEADICLPFVKRQIDMVQPDIIVTMGSLPTQKLLSISTSIGRSRGKWQEIDLKGRKIAVMPIFHPDFLLQNMQQKKQAWLDLQEIQKKWQTL